MTGDVKIFKLVTLLALSNSELKFILQTLVLFYYFGHVAVILLNLGKACREKQPKPSPSDENLEPRTGSGSSYFR